MIDQRFDQHSAKTASANYAYFSGHVKYLPASPCMYYRTAEG